MAKQYQPRVPFNVPFKVITATIVKVNGVNTLSYVEGDKVYKCSAKGYVGSSKYINDLASEEDTLTIDSWFIRTLKKNDRIKLLDDNSIWELPLDPENIDRRSQYTRFKVVRVHG